MVSLLKIEFTKFIKKKDISVIIGLLLVLPIIISLIFKLQVSGINMNGKMTSVYYSLLILSFLKMLFVVYVVPIYIPCVFLGREIDDKNINMLLSKEKREKVLAAKIFMTFAATILFTLLFLGISYVSFKIFLTGTKYELLDLTGIVSGKGQAVIILLQVFEMLFVASFAILLNTFIKGNAALILSFGVIALEKVLQNLSFIKEYIPTYMCDFSRLSTELVTKSGQYPVRDMVLSVVYIVVLIILSSVVWKKRDF